MRAENGHDHVVLEDLDRAARDEVERGEHVAAVHELVARRHVHTLELERQHTQAAGTRACIPITLKHYVKTRHRAFDWIGSSFASDHMT